ncbi:MAG: hypothetical protein ABW168_13940, partial [Sedimenticola sp.]
MADSYNNTPHRTLGRGLSPAEINESNEAEVWDRVYNKTADKYDTMNKSVRQYRFEIDDLVRLAYNRYTFQRDYQQKWTSELFKISDRFMRQDIPIYRVRDFSDETLVGTFYEQELQKVDKADDALWIVEKTIRKRKKAGKVEHLVKFEGWPDKFNSWIPADDIV